MIYNLGDEQIKIVDLALSILGQTYDQHRFDNPKEIFRLREKIKKANTVQLITDTHKRKFADEN